MTAVKTSPIESARSVWAQAEKSLNLPFCLMNPGGAQFCPTELPCFLPLLTQRPPIGIFLDVVLKKCTEIFDHRQGCCIFRYSFCVAVRSSGKAMLLPVFFEPKKSRISNAINMQKHFLANLSPLEVKSWSRAPGSLFTSTFDAGKCLDVGQNDQIKFSTSQFKAVI